MVRCDEVHLHFKERRGTGWDGQNSVERFVGKEGMADVVDTNHNPEDFLINSPTEVSRAMIAGIWVAFLKSASNSLADRRLTALVRW